MHSTNRRARTEGQGVLTESFDRAQPALGLVVPLKQRTRGTPWFCSLTNDYTDLNAAERTGTQTVPETQTEVAQSPSSAPTHTRTRGQGVLTESSDQAQPASGLTAPLTQRTRGTPWFCSLTDANVDPNAASYSTADLCARATRPFEMGMILVIGRKSAASVPVDSCHRSKICSQRSCSKGVQVLAPQPI